MVNVAWVVDFLANLSMRTTAVHANSHAIHAQHNSEAVEWCASYKPLRETWTRMCEDMEQLADRLKVPRDSMSLEVCPLAFLVVCYIALGILA
jgi:hypothetical protein